MNQIYALTDQNFTPNHTLKAQINELLNSGVKIIQYRNKSQNHDISLLKEIAKICKSYNSKFIINDDVNLAKIVQASGVHIGKDDESLKRARDILGYEAFIGVSCYSDLNLARNATKNGADYIAFGSLFPSSSKPNAPLCPLNIIKEARLKFKEKIAVIGGINSSNLNLIKDIGVDYIAIISALYTGGSIKDNIDKLNRALKG
ncbi:MULTISPECIES: thiamine phosphate synthase [Campylobacter]|uniref:thiamine phosphate synthase n=1 Tax=Campylobacter TaxID=194 RepID=UPI000A33F09F|nr:MULTISPECIES: thiamine phosphate synthase [unclassified Campylobacter]MCR8696452.1 thiamine phosphate synthase [Campylobacter sp. RM19073]